MLSLFKKVACLLMIVTLVTLVFAFTGWGKEAPPIKVGVIQPMTGTNAATAREQVTAIKIAVDDVNEQGGLLGGRKIQLIIEDDHSMPSDSVSAARKLITQDKVIAILGPFNSACAFAVRDITNENKIPELLVGGTTDSLVVGYPYLFRANINNSQQSIPFVRWLISDKGYKNIAIIYENTDWGRNLYNITKSIADELGAVFVIEEGYNPGTSDFSAVLTKVKYANPDIIILATLVTESAIILRQARDLQIPGSKFAGWSGLSQSDLPQLADGAEEGALFADVWWPENPDNATAKHLIEQLHKRYPDTPITGFHGQGYAAAITLIDAIKRAGTTDADKLVEAIKTTRMEGLLGDIYFDEDGQNQGILVAIRSWKNGVPVLTGELIKVKKD